LPAIVKAALNIIQFVTMYVQFVSVAGAVPAERAFMRVRALVAVQGCCELSGLFCPDYPLLCGGNARTRKTSLVIRGSRSRMVKKERDCRGRQRRREKRSVGIQLLRQLPLTGIAGLLLWAMVTVLIPACQGLKPSVGQEGTLPHNWLPAALRG